MDKEGTEVNEVMKDNTARAGLMLIYVTEIKNILGPVPSPSQ